jgi:hypothetical protein
VFAIMSLYRVMARSTARRCRRLSSSNETKLSRGCRERR